MKGIAQLLIPVVIIIGLIIAAAFIAVPAIALVKDSYGEAEQKIPSFFRDIGQTLWGKATGTNKYSIEFVPEDYEVLELSVISDGEIVETTQENGISALFDPEKEAIIKVNIRNKLGQETEITSDPITPGKNEEISFKGIYESNSFTFLKKIQLRGEKFTDELGSEEIRFPESTGEIEVISQLVNGCTSPLSTDSFGNTQASKQPQQRASKTFTCDWDQESIGSCILEEWSGGECLFWPEITPAREAGVVFELKEENSLYAPAEACGTNTPFFSNKELQNSLAETCKEKYQQLPSKEAYITIYSTFENIPTEQIEISDKGTPLNIEVTTYQPLRYDDVPVLGMEHDCVTLDSMWFVGAVHGPCYLELKTRRTCPMGYEYHQPTGTCKDL